MHQEEQSLLTHLNEVRSSYVKEGGLSSVIYCGGVLSETDLPAALQHQRAIVETLVNGEGVNVTGILLGQGNAILHLIEGPSYSVLRILQNIALHEDFSNGHQFGSIAYCVEDRPKRFFPEWFSSTIQERKSANDDITEENCKDIAVELANDILGIGSSLSSEAQEELDLAKYANQLPGKNLILSIANSSKYFKLQEFVHLFCEPYHIELESEMSWPLERVVNY